MQIYAQELEYWESEGDTIFFMYESIPSYPGGDAAMMQLLSDSIVYPESAKQAGIGGRVSVSFVVDTIGNVTEVHIIEGIHQDIDEEAIRVVSMLNGWKPGVQRGKKVKVQYQIPLTFHPPKNRRTKKVRKRKRSVD